MLISSPGALTVTNRKRSRAFSYVQRLSRLWSTSSSFGMPTLGTVIDADGDVKHLESGDDAFFGFKTGLRDSDVMRLIETVREDDAVKFSTFNYTLIGDITMNVELADLPVCKA
ncbi:unnamed protein product [Hymenolepis diminuta]|uniref:S1 motif domain-containing protein n=1 Tax=Hymenolepis diminuta TaxID=6216 RepID=A0A0R3SZI6_HYMDI|nr:unnamed protein product [Hymenolepis diminuta]